MERVHKIESELNKPYYKEIDDRRKVKMLEKCVKRLSDAIRGYQQDKILYSRQIKDLNYENERHDKFRKEEEEFAHKKREMVLYYQQTLYEVLE